MSYQNRRVVMVSQNGNGELTIGDSHEYGLVHDPFDKEFINTMITQYLKTFANFKDWKITAVVAWHIPKMTDGKTELVVDVAPGVTVINGIGGRRIRSS